MTFWAARIEAVDARGRAAPWWNVSKPLDVECPSCVSDFLVAYAFSRSAVDLHFWLIDNTQHDDDPATGCNKGAAG
jgi:hypothetical protein